MKGLRLLGMFVLIGVMACSGSKKLSQSGNDEKQFVSEFIDHWMDGTDSEKLKAYISPTFCKSNKIDLDDYNINKYSPKGYKIESYNPKNGEVVALIWGSNKGWMHRLYFSLKMEGNKMYLTPLYPEDDSNYIHPWIKVDAYIDVEE